MAWSRRHFLQASTALAAQTLTGCGSLDFKPKAQAHVVIIGGGFAGATAAKTLRQLDPYIRITLIEPKSIYLSCPASNWLLARLTSLQQLTIEYRHLQDRYSIDIFNTAVTAIEAGKRQVVLENGERLNYDRLIVSPGIDFRWDAIAGYDQALSEQFPHAWQAGAQTLRLAAQLQNLPAGGVIVMSVPADPYRCPPGPYERASMMAWWLKLHNPHGKIIILDHKRSFSKQAQFEHLWKQYYGYGSGNSLIEWHSLADNPINRFDADSKTLSSEFGDRFSGDLINIIPAQQAGRIAVQSGLTDSSGWCQIDPFTAQSKVDAFIHVIGDAAQFAPIPKSAFAAHSEAKSCALAVVSLLRDLPPPAPNWLNTCYSLVTAEHGISIAGVYSLDEQKAIALVKDSGGISRDLSDQALRKEAQIARSVHRNLMTNSFD